MKMITVAMAVSVAAMVFFTSCKGRTTDTVEPSGDTVEVVVSEINSQALQPETPIDVLVDSANVDSVL